MIENKIIRQTIVQYIREFQVEFPLISCTPIEAIKSLILYGGMSNFLLDDIHNFVHQFYHDTTVTSFSNLVNMRKADKRGMYDTVVAVLNESNMKYDGNLEDDFIEIFDNQFDGIIDIDLVGDGVLFDATKMLGLMKRDIKYPRGLTSHDELTFYKLVASPQHVEFANMLEAFLCAFELLINEVLSNPYGLIDKLPFNSEETSAGVRATITSYSATLDIITRVLGIITNK